MPHPGGAKDDRGLVEGYAVRAHGEVLLRLLVDDLFVDRMRVVFAPVRAIETGDGFARCPAAQVEQGGQNGRLVGVEGVGMVDDDGIYQPP